jgi:hypothetical protein
MKKKLKKQILKLIAQQMEAHRTPTGEWYFDPKLQHAFEGVRTNLASHSKRLDILETPNVVSLKKRRA